MLRAPSILLLIVLVVPLSACIAAPQSTCHELPWPSISDAASYLGTLPDGTQVPYNFSFGGPVKSWRGDGSVVRAMEIHFGDQTDKLDLSSGELVQVDGGANALLYLNQGVAYFGSLLYGGCWSKGDSIDMRSFVPTATIAVRVVDASPEQMTVEILDDRQPVPFRPPWGGDRYTLYFSKGTSVPQAVDVHRIPSNELGISWNLSAFVSGHDHTPLPRPPPHALPIVASPGSPFMCTEGDLRHPDLSALDSPFGFDAYLSIKHNDSQLNAYLKSDPSACAVQVAHEIVAEPNSTTYVWTSVYQSPNGDGYATRAAKRCFEGGPWQAIYGPCQIKTYYDEKDDLGSFKARPYQNTTYPAPQVNVIQDRLAMLTDASPTRIVWHAASDTRPSAFLATRAVPETTASGLIIDYGNLSYDVEYLVGAGPNPEGGSYRSEFAQVTPGGWIMMIPKHLLRDPDEATH